jgi:glyoxylase-like metal-dependent hydrolase (beta-lactamase superfamily II)
MAPYKVYILKYARRDATFGELKLGDPHDTTPLDLGYFLWVLTNGEHTAVVDTGFTEALCRKRGRQWLCDPRERLEAIGVDPARVQHVILSHMHWDHAGNYGLFPKATYYVQDDEMAFWTGRYVKYDHFRRPMEVEDVCELVRLNYDGRVQFVNGTEEVLPGVRVHRIGGHTKGVQVTEVPTASGTVVVASDAVHTYPNFREMRPTPIIHNAPEYLEGYDRIRKLARQESYVLPGHDTEQMRVHRAVAEGVAVVE